MLPLHQYVLQTSLAPLAAFIPLLICIVWVCIVAVLVLTYCVRR